MKRNTTLTLMMMLCSVAAAVASPETPHHETMIDCGENLQVAAVDQSLERMVAVPVVSRQTIDVRHMEGCGDADVTAPYRRLHHGGMKLPANCAEAT